MSEPIAPPNDDARERFRRADALFDAALDLPAAERDAFVRRATSGNQTLYDDVATLLSAHDRLGTYLSIPAAPDALGARLQRALGDTYQIRNRIATGGMASVYLADDLRHARQVAIKVFTFDDGPEALDDSGSERFLAEIRTTARLQHPNIVPLFDSGAAGGLRYYVMPFVNGETLRQRLRREPVLPLDESLRVTHTIASALEHAHAEGVIHRDLKPENILLRDGQALVTDFGISLALAAVADQRITRSGMVLGTPQYMSPEQASGAQMIDARTDIYSLAAIVYEMLAGDPPHTGSTASGILAKVITEKPTSVHTLRDTIPKPVADVIDRALAKQPADRFASVRDFDNALLHARTAESRPVAATKRKTTWIIGVVAAAAALLLAVRMLPRLDAPAATSSQFVVAPLADAAIGRAPSITADGASLVYSGSSATGRKLFVRKVSELQARAIPGTEGALNTFLSPDGAWIAFTTTGDKLLKVPIAGGATTPITGVFRYSSAAWAGNDRLIVDGFGQQGLAWVSSAGGPLHQITSLDARRGDSFHALPFVLPDARTVIFTIGLGRFGPGALQGELAMVSLDADDGPHKTYTRLGIQAQRAVGLVDGWLLYVTPGGRGVAAVRFDVGARRVSGTARSVLEHVDGKIDIAALAQNGTLLYTRQLEAEANAPVLVDTAGVATTMLAGVEGSFMNPRLSPDGTKLIVQSTTSKGNDIWQYDIATRTQTRVTNSGDAVGGTWTPDGQRTIYFSSRGGRDAFWANAVDGSVPPKRVLSAAGLFAASVSHDGTQLIFQRIIDGVWGVWSAALDGDTTLHPIVVATYDAFMPSLSPDGRWLAYAANESGRYEIYLRPYLEPGAVVQVSQDGGTEPAWSADGQRLYFRDGRRMLVAQVRTTPSVTITDRHVLFSDAFDGDMPMPHRNYDIARDGRHFVMLAATPGKEPQTIVVLNWLTDFRARIAAVR
jgi:eukaryotic-like serine/threonine-protein kinase